MLTLPYTHRIAALAIALCLPVVAGAVVIDDFESYSTGELATVGAPIWTVENAPDASIAEDAGNQFLTFGGTDDWRHTYRQSSTAILTTGQLSFDIYVTDEATDHAIGLADSTEAVDWYGDYGPYIRVTDDTSAAADVVSLDTRDGGGFVDDIATLNLNQWYNVRLDIDTADGGTFDIYLDDSQVYTGAGFRRAFAGPLENFLLMGGNGIGQAVRVDNIEIDGLEIVLGDTDANGVVELDDYYPIRDNFQQAVADRSSGDLDLSGTVDFLDFREWKDAYVAAGNSLAGIDFSFLSVPEPTTATLVLLGLAGLARRR